MCCCWIATKVLLHEFLEGRCKYVRPDRRMNLGIPELMDHIKLPVILLTKLTAHHSTQHVMQKDK